MSEASQRTIRVRASITAACLMLAGGCNGSGNGTGGGGGEGGSGGPACGNGVIDGLEQCDGAALDGKDCTDGGFDGGTLACAGDCTFDTDGCTGGTPPECGNDAKEGLESCDGADLDGTVCADVGTFNSGALSCTGSCTFDAVDCASGTGGSDGTGGGGGNGGASPFPEWCNIGGVELTKERVRSGEQSLTYRAASSDEEPYDFIHIGIYDYRGGPTMPGIFSLLGVNYQDCGLCIVGGRTCTRADGCEKTFFASAGTVYINSLGDENLKFKAYLDDVFLREVTINDDYYSLPVPGGELWCAHETSIEVERLPTQDVCVTDGTGGDLNENVADFLLPNCNGDLKSLHASCAAVKAMRLLAVAGWCGACTEEVPIAFGEATADPDLGLWIILGEDLYGEAPSLSYCQQYAEEHDIPPSRILVDPLWSTTWYYLNPNIVDSFYLPWNAVLDGDNMEYVYCDSCPGTQTLDQAVNALLDD